MKKLLVGVLVLALSVLGAMPVHAGTNDFTISSYNVDMQLGRDSDRRSTLSVTETITAEFPSYDQNHGLERVFVQQYDGHSLNLNITSVTNAVGETREYSLNDGVMRIGSADTYAHGTNTYVIHYTMRDVTKYYSDTNSDEFYWDVIGTDWQVPIMQAEVNLAIAPELETELSGNKACYVGVAGATTTCDIRTTEKGYTMNVTGIGNGSGVTLAVGFRQGTFAAYQQSLGEVLLMVWTVLQFIITPVAVIMAIVFVVMWFRRLNRDKEVGTIVPEYLPPKEASVTTAARVTGFRTSVMTAQMLDLAVRHYVKIYEAKEKTLFAAAEYEIEIVRDPSDLRAEEQELLKDTFGSLPAVGERMNLKELQNNPSYYTRTLNNDSELDALIRGAYELREVDSATKRWAQSLAKIALIFALIFLSPFVLIMALMLFGMSFACWRLTDKGLALRRYLEGLKLYIGVAEVDRIAMLQSPEGAEKVASVAKGTDETQLIKLYEKVLPYAVLFGQEKDWNKQLGRYYEASNTNPDWYAGNNAAFNALAFSSAMSSFSQANNYASSSSSSSGGSGGGGSSGGGGGGGGGGGW